METQIENYIDYLNSVKHASANTIASYRRDLKKMSRFFADRQCTDVRELRGTDSNSYVLDMESQGMSTATISRSIASMKSFFLYLLKQGEITEDYADALKPPKIEKKAPETLSIEEINLLLDQPSRLTPKEIRDKAMLELLYATGMRVSELINLKITDVNLTMNYILCRDVSKERVIRECSEDGTGELYQVGTGIHQSWKYVPLYEYEGTADDETGLLETDQGICSKGWYRQGYHTAYDPSFLCITSGIKWCRFEGGTGDAWTFGYFDHADLSAQQTEQVEGRI